MNWKGYRRKWLSHNLRSHSNICLKELRKMKILSHDRRDLNPWTLTWSRNRTWPWYYVRSTKSCIGLILHNSTLHKSWIISYRHKHNLTTKDTRWSDPRNIQLQITTGPSLTRTYQIYSNRKWPPCKPQMLQKIPTQNTFKFRVWL